MLEIYNEKIRDLLSKTPVAKQKLDIKHGKSGPHVPGLEIQPVTHFEEVTTKFDLAEKNRATASHDMNNVGAAVPPLLCA